MTHMQGLIQGYGTAQDFITEGLTSPVVYDLPTGPVAVVTVNLFSREESDIRPRPDLAFTGTEVSPPSTVVQRPLEIWPWVLFASLVLLSVEWWFYNRAGRLRLRLRLGRKQESSRS